MNKVGKLFVVSGPSGAGKTTIVKYVLEQYGKEYNLNQFITYTTKKPRNNTAAENFNFISKSEFEAKIISGFFLEYSDKYNYFYGTSIELLEELKSGKSFILVIDVNGAAQILLKYPNAIFIFITVENISILFERLKQRNTESIAEIYFRLNQALEEKRLIQKANFYNFYIENNSLLNSIETFIKILKKYF